MDIVRTPRKSHKRYFIAGGVLVGIVAVTLALRKLEPAAPTIERGTLWIDSVQRGTMLREVRAPGTLVPEQIRWVSALTAGRVERLPVRAGASVTEQTVLLELSNPDVQLQALDAQRQLAAAQAELVNLRTNLETQRLNQMGVVATIRSEYNEAKRNADVQLSLDAKGMTSANESGRAKDRAAELDERLRVEQDRLRILTSAMTDQIRFQEAQVARMRAVAQFHEGRVASMIVRAGQSGTLQQLPLELGQWVVPGQQMATVAEPGRLKAVLRVPETQGRDLAIGQRTSIDTRNGLIAGRVMRIDPAAQNGTIGVEIALEGELPRGARSDMSVDGTIEIERLTDVLHVSRPAYGQAESVVSLFKLEPDGRYATRVSVKLGRGSVNTIEILQGLAVNDKVIISDMSAWDNVDRVRLR